MMQWRGSAAQRPHPSARLSLQISLQASILIAIHTNRRLFGHKVVWFMSLSPAQISSVVLCLTSACVLTLTLLVILDLFAFKILKNTNKI